MNLDDEVKLTERLPGFPKLVYIGESEGPEGQKRKLYQFEIDGVIVKNIDFLFPKDQIAQHFLRNIGKRIVSKT